MLTKEYRIPMPITAEEYQIGQLFMIAKHSHEQSDAGEGVEVILNVPHTDPVHGEGRYTEKQIHLSSRLPDWLQSFIPRLFCVTEKAWNYYPYTETEYTCSFLPKFNIFIKTKYENNSGTTENCLGLSPEELANRIVEHVDIVYDEVAPKHYKETEDPKFFKSKKTNRGPLINGWQETFESIMCSYKLVNVSFEVWGLQTKVEDYAHKAIRDILLLGHRQAFAWIDEWYGMTIEDVREYEVKMQEETNKKVLKRSEAVEISQDAGAGAIEVEEGNDEEGNSICKNLKEKAFKDAEKEKDNNEDMSKYEDDYHMPKPQSKTGSVGKSILVESNIFKIDIQDGEDHVFVYAVYFDLEEVLEYRKLSVESVRARIGNTYLYDGTFLYSLGKLPKCVMKFRIPHPMKPEIVLKFKVMYRSKSKLGKCQGLLKHLITTLPEFLGCKPHHRIFYSPGICKKVPNSDIEVYGAYRLRVAQAELSPTIIVDVIHCLQRERTIANVFTTFNGQLEDKLLKLKNYCLGKFAADIAHNVVVKVGDVYMKDIAIPWLKVWTKSHPEKKLPNRCEECLTVSSSSYSLLVNRNGVTPSSSEKTNITKFTKVSPNVRVKCIQRFVEAVHGNIECTDFLRQWKIILNPKPVTVRARVIPSPCVSFGGEVQIQNSRLFWNPKEDAPTKMVLDPIELHTWSLFCLESVVPLAQKLLASLFFESKSLGVIIGRGSLEIVKMKHRRPLVSLLAEKMLRKINAGTRFVIVILPNTSGAFEAKEVYSQLKKICMVSCRVLSQMINTKTLKSRAKSAKTWNAFVGGVISGMVCKLGGSLWCVHVPLKEKVMFVGMDVWHGSNNEVFSVGGLIFSLDTNLLKIYSAAVLHEWRQEIFNSIRDHFVLALKAFVEENKQLPDRVMIYRDGVLRRDYKTLLLHELKQYMEVIDMLYVGRRPFLSMVVVQKRVYERFFAKLETGKYVNSPPGTVIDHDMTRKRCYDFFLNSMYRKKGTTIPTHYVMVYDNSNMSPDVFHQVTYSLCYSYFNWPGTFYVPSVVQYAHKLASHVGKVGVIPPVNLSKLFHFL